MTILMEGVQTVKGLGGFEKKTPHMLHKCNFSHVEHFMHSYPTGRVVSSTNILCILHL
jgi:hypothetical protein